MGLRILEGSHSRQLDQCRRSWMFSLAYNPPAGVLGDAGEKLGAGSRFEKALQHDLDNFARMVDQAPPGALDPQSSNYLFHGDSAATKCTTTSRQDATMADEKRDRPTLDQDIINEPTGVGSTKYNRDVMGGPDVSTERPVMPPDRDLGSSPEVY